MSSSLKFNIYGDSNVDGRQGQEDDGPRGATDKLRLTGQNLGQVFSSRTGCICVLCTEAKEPNLKLTKVNRQLLGSILLAFALPD